MSTQLGAQDAQFLYLQRGDVLTHVMSINVYDPGGRRGRSRYRELVRHVASRCRGSPIYRRRLHRVPGDLDFPYWVEDAGFDPVDHISRLRLPRPGGWPEFCSAAARHFEQPMDLERPLWDILVVEGLETLPGVAPGSYALLQRFHHAAIDGASGAHALAVLCDLDPQGTPAVTPQRGDDDAAVAPTPGAIVSRALASGVAAPVKMVDAVLKLSPALLAAAEARLAGKTEAGAGTVPVTRFNTRVARRRSFAATAAKLEVLRAIGRSVPGATVNDVILAVCSGALRQYLAMHDDLPAASLVAIAPVNARRRSGRSEASGNDVSAMTVPIATHLAEPLARLRAVREFTDLAKQSRAGLGARLLTDLGRHIPGLPLAGFARLLTNERFARSQANLIITNVPSSREPLYMNGARLTHQFGMGPVSHGLGLFISANGYHDTITFCLTADSGLVPDLDVLCRCVEDSLRELQAAARAPRRRAARKPRPARKRGRG